VIIALGVGCGDVPPAEHSTLIVIDMPHGGQRIHVQRDGSGHYTYGALPTQGRFPAGTFDFAALHSQLAGLAEAERRQAAGDYGTVIFCRGAGDCSDILYFYDKKHADRLFRLAYENRLPPAAEWQAAGLQALDRIWARSGQASPEAGPTGPTRATTGCVVQRIIDGDTFECRGLGRIRLIGMDTPELSQAPYGRMATEAIAGMIPAGTRVEIEPDIEPRDRYNRLLGYVWADGALVNWQLVRQGWAVLYTIPPNVQYADFFAAAQERAREEGAGLWAEGGFDCLPAEHRQGRCREES
jgi:micrococcal nuclease